MSIVFHSPKLDYLQYIDFNNEDKKAIYSEEDILIEILDHFLLDFIQNKHQKFSDALLEMRRLIFQSTSLEV